MRISIKEAATLLLQGKVVAVPTETVYGLAACLAHTEAIAKIYKLKKRPASNPLIIHIASLQEIAALAIATPKGFDALASAFWPGALTLILPIDPTKVPKSACAGLPTAGFRIPSNPIALELLRLTGPLVMPSANLSGKPSATCKEHIELDFGASFPVIEGPASDRGLESTIAVFQDGRWQIIRLGAIPVEAFEPILGYVPKVTVETKGQKPLCPGQLFRHYAPKAHLKLVTECANIDQGAIVGFSDRHYPPGLKVFSLGPCSDVEQVAKNLYGTLRKLDDQHIEQAFVDCDFPKEGVWLTIAERLKRAAQK